jgi:hypothetical protein
MYWCNDGGDKSAAPAKSNPTGLIVITYPSGAPIIANKSPPSNLIASAVPTCDEGMATISPHTKTVFPQKYPQVPAVIHQKLLTAINHPNGSVSIHKHGNTFDSSSRIHCYGMH